MSIVEESFRLYWGNSEYWILFVLSLIVILAITREKDIKWMFSGYAIMIILVILNPMFSFVIDRLHLIDSSTTYVRVYYLLPVTVTIAYAVTIVIERQNSNLRKALTLILFCAVIGLSGESYLERNAYQKTENQYKIPQEEVDVAESILSDCGDGMKARTLVLSWDDNWYLIRQYTSRIVNAGSAMPPERYKDETFTCQGELNPYFLFMKNNGVQFDYVIQLKEEGMKEECVAGGHTILLETDKYLVIKVDQTM